MEKHWPPLSRAAANRAEGTLQSEDCPLCARHWPKRLSCLPAPSPPKQREMGPLSWSTFSRWRLGVVVSDLSREGLLPLEGGCAGAKPSHMVVPSPSTGGPVYPPQHTAGVPSHPSTGPEPGRVLRKCSGNAGGRQGKSFGVGGEGRKFTVTKDRLHCLSAPDTVSFS